jgi:hypothetical protein
MTNKLIVVRRKRNGSKKIPIERFSEKNSITRRIKLKSHEMKYRDSGIFPKGQRSRSMDSCNRKRDISITRIPKMPSWIFFKLNFLRKKTKIYKPVNI